MHPKIRQILDFKREEIKMLAQRPIKQGSNRRDMFYKVFAQTASVGLIAEVKLASPTEPTLGLGTDVAERVRQYTVGGAKAISVITESHFFKGDITLISEAKKHTLLPVLQKDFVIDPSQIYQAQQVGSDALLLIARIVSEQELKEFVSLALKVGVEPVVEIFSREDLVKTLKTKARIIAVNARDLDTFTINRKRATALLRSIPKGYLTFGFSGVRSKKDIDNYVSTGVCGVLIGTELMKSLHPDRLLKELQGL